jgi:hypothetical protein
LKSGASRGSIAWNAEIRVKGGRRGRQEYIPALLFIKLVTDVLRELLELTFDLASSVVSTMRPPLGCAPFELNCWCWCLVGDVFDSALVMRVLVSDGMCWEDLEDWMARLRVGGCSVAVEGAFWHC